MKKFPILAVFILGASTASAQIVSAPWLGWVPPPATGTVFLDVPADSFGAAWIEAMFNDGITAGCAPGYFCPEAPATRSQMAIFIERVYHSIPTAPPPVGGSVIYGGGSCGYPDGPLTGGNRCTGTVTDSRILPGMAIVATYTSHGNEALVFPIEITNVTTGSFDFSIQRPSSFSWIGTGGITE